MQTFLHYRWRVPSTLHRLHLRRIIPLLLLALCVTGAKAQTYQSYDANTCYTKVLIEKKINDFAGNTKPMGFGSYDDETGKITQPVWYNEIAKENTRNLAIDYVAGLVAKACIEAAVYYQDFTWSKPWFKLVENYATNAKVTVPTTGASLDDLNAAKMYFALADLTNKGAKYENSTTYNRAISELQNAIEGLKAVNTDYSIRSGSTVNYYSSGKQTWDLVDANNNKLSPTTSGMNAIGGWYHKATYPNQMWCDSEYMGPALLAQLVAYATENEKAGIGTVTSSKVDDWKLIAKQFDITWNYLWNSKDQLLYHGFSATPTAIAAHTYTWATGTNGTNTAYWGRAIGWYFLALVDVLEKMPNDISDDTYTSTQTNLSTRDANIKTRLTSYLTDLAAGIWQQKKDNYLWTNVINEAVDTEHTSYSTTDAAKQSNTKNYLEASASAIYIAAYIKAMRLGLLPSGTYKLGIETAYQNYISNFITDKNTIINTCASAGLGGGSVAISTEEEDYKSGGSRYRNGTADYYTRGYDVTKVTDYQEGKPLGAFILASTEYERYLKDDYKPSFTAANAEKPTAKTVTKGQSVTLHAAAMAKPLATYQWYSYTATSTRATDTQGTPISGATSSDLTVKPDVNTYYYCVATNTVNNATATAQTDPVLVTVSEADGIENGGSGAEESVIATFENATATTWKAKEDNGFSISGVKIKSGTSYVKMESGTTLTMTIPSGYTVTGLNINALCASGDANSELTYKNGETNLGTVTINSGNTLGDYNCTFSSNVTGPATITITRGAKEVNINTIKVLGYQGTPSSLSITQPVGATYDYGVSEEKVTALSVTAEKTGIEGDITYQWYSNKTNSNTNGTPIDGATSASYKPVVTTAGTTYYYCVVSAGVKSVTSDAVAVAVLNPSNLAINTESNYKKNSNAWTPAVGGTISITDLVTSSSMGAYSITTGDAATLDGTSLTAVKDGTITLKQAADDNYKEGSIEITVRIGQNVTNNNTNEYSFTAETNVSDGMTIACKDITMTFGNDGFWSKPSANGYTGGQVTPVVTSNIPTKGTFYKFRATTTGSLAVKIKLNVLVDKLRPLYVSENGTPITAKLEDNTEVGKGETPSATSAYDNKSVTFPVKANTDYYVYVPGSKLAFYGFTFEPATLYTVTFDAGTNGTCSTTSLMQESANATITLPSVTPKTGYKFDGWYTAAEEEGGTKVESPYKPERDITLFARYTSTVSSTVVATFVTPQKTTWTATEKNGFTITGVSNIKTDKSAKLSSGGSITLNIPEGYTVTGFDFTLLCANTTEGSTLSVGDDEISVKDGTHTLHHMNLSSSVTGPTTLTITNSGGKELNIQSIKVYGSNGKSISFTTHPQDAEYVKDATSVTELTVAAKLNNVTGNAPSISYQWYKNTTTKSTDGGTEISGQTSASYTPDVSTAGTTYYYCKATATVDEEALEAYSNIATVTVSNPTLTIVTEPVGATYAQGQSGVVPLMVEAKTNTGSTITYQWYSKTSETTESATLIDNATSAEYKPSVEVVGTIYYYCEVKSGTLTETTKIVAITVNSDQPIYGYKVSKAALPAPGINTSKYITTTSDETGDTGEKLVKMTFGGWKWKNGTYTKPGSDTPITDTWKASETVSGVNVLDGYQYWFSGTQDAKQENKDAETEMYGQIRNGWFVSPTRENGITTDSHPYTLPVRGSFMTFEPTKNGTLTIYILQNGAWNTFDKDTQLDGVSYKKGAIKPGEFRMHAFQITNQRGLVLAEFAPNYSVTNNQKVQEGYRCTEYLTRPSSFDKTSTDVSKWEEFWTLSKEERKAVYDNWSVESNGGCQEIIKLENGSFLAIQKAVVKYKFHVTGNETYYFFSNFSKMGFSGATFQPDADSGQPTDDTTFSGVNNSLSDTKPYTKITPTADGEIEGTGLTKYKYTINGTDIKLVDGVFIPQFKAITLNRTFKPKQWTTLTLPFNLTQTEVEQIFGKDTQILVFEDAETNGTKLHIKLFYHEIQNILPGYPYLIKPTLEGYDNGTTTQTDNAPTRKIEGESLTSFTVYDKAINPHIKQYEFKSKDNQYVAKGTPDYCTQALTEVGGGFCKKYEKGDIFISDGDGKLYISQGASYGKGYRSYIDGPASSATKTLSLSFSGVEDGEDDGTTTEISVAELADDVIEAFGIKGVYNLNGQKVAETTRNLPAGIYVVNGRKVVVK